MRALIILGLCVLLTGCGSTSNETLRGRLVKDGAPVAATTLALAPLDGDGDTLEATTDARGRFEVTGLSKGRYRLTAHHNIADVFECDVPYVVDVPTTVAAANEFAVPVVDVGTNGRATLPKGRKTTCRTLRDPLQPYVCEAAQYPLTVYALPARDSASGKGYRANGKIREADCARARVLGRAGSHRWGWLLVSLGRGKQGWMKPRFAGRLPAQLAAWEDAALASVAKLPTSKPTLAGGGLPDLEFTTPQQSAHVGESCSLGMPVANEWLVGVRNVGTGLAPNRPVEVSAFIEWRGKWEKRVAGGADWIRGLAPGESAPLREAGYPYSSISSNSRLTLDPNNRVRESNEQNNTVTLGLLSSLTCG